jgi:deazaflavin-dependent oxidoreductase (nitroreductase family)
MAKPHYSVLHRAGQGISSTKPGSWFFARTLHHFDRAFLALTGGRATLSTLLAGLPEVMVTTIGAKSGLMRTLPLVYIRDDTDPRTFALIASNFGQHHNPAWYYNLKAHPAVTCTLDGQTGEYVAREATGEEYAKFWQAAVDTYFGYALYKTRASHRHIPIMILSPKQQ